jgi:tetratricopeptide (TPR) repeat protein
MSAFGTTEFEFIEDEGDGKFITSGGDLLKLQALINQGDVDQASRLYDESGGKFAADLQKDASIGSNVSRGRIAEVFRRSHDFAAAAAVLELMASFAEAAKMYEQASDFPSAARCHRAAGNTSRAAPAMERSGEYEPALELYRKEGNLPAVAECLVRLKRFTEAAQVYQKLGNVHAEVEVLREIAPSDPEAIAATTRLADLMEKHGHQDKAAALIVATFRANKAARSNATLQTQLLRLLEGLGKHEDAKKVRATLGLTGGAARPTTSNGEEITAKTPVRALASEADDYAHLKAIPIFGELALPDMHDLFRVAQEVSYPQGSALIDQGAASRGLTVIVAGKVDVSAVANGSTRLLNTLSAGAYVGEIGLVQDAPASARVTAQTEVRALFISKAAFEHYLYERPSAALAIYRLFTSNLAQRVRSLSEHKA